MRRRPGRPTAIARRSARRRVLVVAVAVAVAALTSPLACGSGSSGEAAGTRELGATLRMPTGTDAATRSSTLAAVRTRLARFPGHSTATATGDTITVRPRPDADVLEALARRARTTLVTVDATTIGPCGGDGGVPGPGPAARCYRLGAPITDTAAVTGTDVGAEAVDGWGVDVTVDAARYAPFRDAIAPHRGATVAVVADGAVLAGVSLSAVGLRSRIAGQLRRDDARRVADALLVATDLPVPLRAPTPRAGRGADAGDAWMAQLAVQVCGRWLPPAPDLTSEVGLHSHGDGLVYVHSLPRAQVGQVLTLGRFLTKGGWRMTADRLRLWDGVDIRDGDACGATRSTAVRWTVDGVPRAGAPAATVLAPARVIVVAFGPTGAPVPAPPAISPLLATVWGPQLP